MRLFNKQLFENRLPRLHITPNCPPKHWRMTSNTPEQEVINNTWSPSEQTFVIWERSLVATPSLNSTLFCVCARITVCRKFWHYFQAINWQLHLAATPPSLFSLFYLESRYWEKIFPLNSVHFKKKVIFAPSKIFLFVTETHCRTPKKNELHI